MKETKFPVGTNSCLKPDLPKAEVKEQKFKLDINEVVIAKSTITKTVEVSLSEYCGGKIKQLRKAAGLKQEEVAVKIGILRTTLSHIENGKIKLTIEHLHALCQLYNRKSSDILPF